MLSGGEKSRLALARLLINPPNMLLMDEPTTHLDIPSIDALVNALKQYEGTLIFISHDVYFIRTLAQTVLHVHSGRLTPYSGNYDYYLDKSKAANARAALTAGFTDARPKQQAAAPCTRREERPSRRPQETPHRSQRAGERKFPNSKRSRTKSRPRSNHRRLTPTRASFHHLKPRAHGDRRPDHASHCRVGKSRQPTRRSRESVRYGR